MSTRTIHNPTATRDNLAGWLAEQGFKDTGEHDSWSDGTWHGYDKTFRLGPSVRVAFMDGQVRIYVFEKNEILDWDVRLTNAPRGTVTAVITDALENVRATMLPQD